GLEFFFTGPVNRGPSGVAEACASGGGVGFVEVGGDAGPGGVVAGGGGHVGAAADVAGEGRAGALVEAGVGVAVCAVDGQGAGHAASSCSSAVVSRSVSVPRRAALRRARSLRLCFSRLRSSGSRPPQMPYRSG